jgi:hypothetical protein
MSAILKQLQMIALLNAPVLTSFGKFEFEQVDIDTARKLVVEGFQSYIGHQSTCDVLSSLLQLSIPLNREQYYQNPGEQALVFRLKSRLPAGFTIDTVEAIIAQGYDLGILKMIP